MIGICYHQPLSFSCTLTATGCSDALLHPLPLVVDQAHYELLKKAHVFWSLLWAMCKHDRGWMSAQMLLLMLLLLCACCCYSIEGIVNSCCTAIWSHPSTRSAVDDKQEESRSSASKKFSEKTWNKFDGAALDDEEEDAQGVEERGVTKQRHLFSLSWSDWHVWSCRIFPDDPSSSSSSSQNNLDFIWMSKQGAPWWLLLLLWVKVVVLWRFTTTTATPCWISDDTLTGSSPWTSTQRAFL